MNISAIDFSLKVPESVTITFPKIIDDVVQSDVYVVYLGIQDLGIPKLPATVSGNGNKLIRSEAIAKYLDFGDTDPQNKAELDSFASLYARDYLRWEFGRVDATFAGVAEWVPDGFSDILIEQTANELTTRIFSDNAALDVVKFEGTFGSIQLIDNYYNIVIDKSVKNIYNYYNTTYITFIDILNVTEINITEINIYGCTEINDRIWGRIPVDYWDCEYIDGKDVWVNRPILYTFFFKANGCPSMVAQPMQYYLGGCCDPTCIEDPPPPCCPDLSGSYCGYIRVTTPSVGCDICSLPNQINVDIAIPGVLDKNVTLTRSDTTSCEWYYADPEPYGSKSYSFYLVLFMGPGFRLQINGLGPITSGSYYDIIQNITCANFQGGWYGVGNFYNSIDDNSYPANTTITPIWSAGGGGGGDIIFGDTTTSFCLEYTGGEFSGSFEISGVIYSVTISCVSATGGEVRWQVSITDGTTTITAYATTAICSPVSILFAKLSINGIIFDLRVGDYNSSCCTDSSSVNECCTEYPLEVCGHLDSDSVPNESCDCPKFPFAWSVTLEGCPIDGTIPLPHYTGPGSGDWECLFYSIYYNGLWYNPADLPTTPSDGTYYVMGVYLDETNINLYISKVVWSGGVYVGETILVEKSASHGITNPGLSSCTGTLGDNFMFSDTIEIEGESYEIDLTLSQDNSSSSGNLDSFCLGLVDGCYVGTATIDGLDYSVSICCVSTDPKAYQVVFEYSGTEYTYTTTDVTCGETEFELNFGIITIGEKDYGLTVNVDAGCCSDVPVGDCDPGVDHGYGQYGWTWQPGGYWLHEEGDINECTGGGIPSYPPGDGSGFYDEFGEWIGTHTTTYCCPP